jgi:hypothetical protein
LKRQQLVLAQLEQLIAQAPPSNAATQQALSIQRAQFLASITGLKFDQNYMEQSLKNLADFTENLCQCRLSMPPMCSRLDLQTDVCDRRDRQLYARRSRCHHP